MKKLAYYIILATTLVAATSACKYFDSDRDQHKKEKQYKKNRMMKMQEKVMKAEKVIAPFYALLSGQDTEEQVRMTHTPNWMSYYSTTDYRNLDDTIKIVKGFSKSVKDLKWNPQIILPGYSKEGIQTITVISNATGIAKTNSFFGQRVRKGNKFSIMSIDVQYLNEEGIIFKTYHVEDWASGISQLKKKIKNK